MSSFIWFPFKWTFQQQFLLEYPWERKPAYSFVTVNHKKGSYIYLAGCSVYFFQVKNIVKLHFLHLQEHHQMLWFNFSTELSAPVSTSKLIGWVNAVDAFSSAVVERGIKMYLLLYATFLQLRTITLPMQESVIKNLILSSLVRVSSLVFQLRQLHSLGFFSSWHWKL